MKNINSSHRDVFAYANMRLYFYEEFLISGDFFLDFFRI